MLTRKAFGLLLASFGLVAFLVALFPLNMINTYASADVSGPWPVEPQEFPIAPWETIKIRMNVSNAEAAVTNVTLFYNFSSSSAEEPRNWEDFDHLAMTLETGDEYSGSWSHEFKPPHENGTAICYFVSMKDSLGNELSAKCTPTNANRLPIFYSIPMYEIRNFRIDEINEKNLTVAFSFSVYIRRYNCSDWIDAILDVNGNSPPLRIPRVVGLKCLYMDNCKLTGILSGSPDIPFDSYRLYLTFRSASVFECAPVLIDEYTLPNNEIEITDYNDKSIWKAYLAENRTVGISYLDISVDVQRKTESAYFFVIPALVCFFLLGGTPLLSIEKGDIRHRLTIYLTIFVFLVGSYMVSERLTNMIPEMAYGTTTAEVTVISLALYSGVFGVCSMLSYFLGDIKIKGRVALGPIIDLAAPVVSIYLFFSFHLVSIHLSGENYYTYALCKDSNPLWFNALIILGLSYGSIIRFARLAFSRFSRKITVDY